MIRCVSILGVVIIVNISPRLGQGAVVDYQRAESTLHLADTLIKSKSFELIVVPGIGHSGDGEYGKHKRKDFFVKHLLDVEQPEWGKLNANQVTEL